jgi:macrolide transport system ATP-binding/permease protein
VIIGDFDQSQSNLKKEKSVLGNITKNSSYDQGFIRINLDNFGFKGDNANKQISLLS